MNFATGYFTIHYNIAFRISRHASAQTLYMPENLHILEERYIEDEFTMHI